MASTIKVTGAGPFAGRTFYGELVYVGEATFMLELDEAPVGDPFYADNPKYKFTTFLFYRDGGCMYDAIARGTSDLLHVCSFDVPRLDEALTLWKDEAGDVPPEEW